VSYATRAAIGCPRSRSKAGLMQRRAFIAGLGSTVTWPLVARAQQVGGVRRLDHVASPAVWGLEGAASALPDNRKSAARSPVLRVRGT
jgi:hypothetical protein